MWAFTLIGAAPTDVGLDAKKVVVGVAFGCAVATRDKQTDHGARDRVVCDL